MSNMKGNGFTLIEVLVAIAIVAVALAAGIGMSLSLVQQATRAPQLVLAELCARNAMTALRLARQPPALGQSQQACDQAGQSFTVALSVSATASPDFRQVQAQIRHGNQPLLRVLTVVGRD